MSVFVSPKRFKDASEKVLSKHDKLLRTHWKYPKKFTDLVWGAKHSRTGVIYKDIAQELGMTLIQEYWEIDAAYYKEKCPLASTKFRERATILSIALEHENNAHGTCLEINKLLTFTALLKVVVAYPKEGETAKIYFDAYKKQIEAVDKIIPKFSAYQEIMIVFGYRQGVHKPLIWHYHVYDWFSGEFKLLD